MTFPLRVTGTPLTSGQLLSHHCSLETSCVPCRPGLQRRATHISERRTLTNLARLHAKFGKKFVKAITILIADIYGVSLGIINVRRLLVYVACSSTYLPSQQRTNRVEYMTWIW